MKIIDFEKHGNVVRFYFGPDELKDWYGDDWDDAPYDCNAGTVYDEFMSGWFDVAWDAGWKVMEPCDGVRYNCSFCKDDMKAQKVPCIVAVKADECDWLDFSRHAGDMNAKRIYFGEKLSSMDTYMQNGFREGRVLKWVDVVKKKEC